MTTVLICTVGGTAAPIVTALRELKPDYVVFACSGPDPGTGTPGSERQVTGRGCCIKASPEEPTPSLPNIPSQAGLDPGRFEVLVVPADDLDTAFSALDTGLRQLRARFPEARLVADYTGGTKTMTAALVTAALEQSDVELQVVTGNRANLVRVTDGTQVAAPAGVDGIRIGRAIAAQTAAWRRFAYEEAAEGLARVSASPSNALRARLGRARDLSRAFSAWDRFDHREALRLLDQYASRVGRQLGGHLQALRILASTEQTKRREGLQIWDLWLNAQRRAAAGRYDDAIARVYRVIEWTAQSVLRWQAGIDTANIPPERIPDGVNPTVGRDGRRQAGLFVAWQFVAAHTTGDAAQFFREHRDALLDLLKRRNASILAHGFEPIDGDTWAATESFVVERFTPVLKAELAAVGLGSLCPQLPNVYLWDEP